MELNTLSLNHVVDRSLVLTLIRVSLLIEYLLNGVPRCFSWPPLASAHDHILRKSRMIAARLPDPFRFSTDPWTADLHIRYVGFLMIVQGVLVGMPKTSGSLGALVLGSFLTVAGFWSQRVAGVSHWRPAVTFCLGLVVFLAHGR